MLLAQQIRHEIITVQHSEIIDISPIQATKSPKIPYYNSTHVSDITSLHPHTHSK